MVFSSSATVYGQPEKVPCFEDSPLKALNPYGRTKVNSLSLHTVCQKRFPDTLTSPKSTATAIGVIGN